MTLIADSSALIVLARTGYLDVLHRVAGTVHIPEAVYQEVVARGHGRPGSTEVGHAEWIVRRPVEDRTSMDRLSERVGAGEAEAIALARELQADALILDDATARVVAEGEGVKVLGTLGFLIYAKKRGAVSAVKPILDDMIAAGFFVDDQLYRTILVHAQEGP